MLCLLNALYTISKLIELEVDMSMNLGFCYSLIQKRDIQEYFKKISNIVLHQSFFFHEIKMKILKQDSKDKFESKN